MKTRLICSGNGHCLCIWSGRYDLPLSSSASMSSEVANAGSYCLCRVLYTASTACGVEEDEKFKILVRFGRSIESSRRQAHLIVTAENLVASEFQKFYNAFRPLKHYSIYIVLKHVILVPN